MIVLSRPAECGRPQILSKSQIASNKHPACEQHGGTAAVQWGVLQGQERYKHLNSTQTQHVKVYNTHRVQLVQVSFGQTMNQRVTNHLCLCPASTGASANLNEVNDGSPLFLLMLLEGILN